MPTEHEYKYILNPSCFNFIDNELKGEFISIEQGYLPSTPEITLRIRKIYEHNGNIEWRFTLKQNINGRVIEIETCLEPRDAEDLWKTCTHFIKKRRYLYDNQIGKWEIDFFEKDQEWYFSVMEIELEEGSPRPKEIPEFIKDHIIYQVDLTDNRFSNRKLDDVAYAKTLLKNII